MSIYVLRYGDLIKIGFSGDLSSRVQWIMAAIPGEVAFVGHMPGDREVEQHLHGRFEEERFSGEWFVNSERLRAFCDAALTPELPERVDRRTGGNRRRREYPQYALDLRVLGRDMWPETDHKERIALLAPVLGWTNSRTKKLYYGEDEQIAQGEADRLTEILAEVQAQRGAMK